MYIDTHCHLDDGKFNDIEFTVKEYTEAKVHAVINMGCDYKSSLTGKKLSDKYNSVYFGVGIHPENLDGITDNDFEKILSLAKEKKCVAIGEIGLDYHFVSENKEVQKEVFLRQMYLANEIDLPVCIHSRDAMKDTLGIIKSVKLSRGGVMHCYSGSKETAKELLDKGYYFGFGGTLTFKNSVINKEVVKYLPIDRILSETDSPYLSPEPYRGSINSPKNVKIVVEKIAELKEKSVEEIAKILNENAKRLFYKISKAEV